MRSGPGVAVGRRRVMLGLALGVILSVVRVPAAVVAVAAVDATDLIRVDVRPFFPRREFVQSLVLTLRSNGQVRACNYAPNALVVLEFRDGTLGREETERWIARLTAPEFRRALERPAGSGAGRTDGDPFTLMMPAKGGVSLECAGFVQDSAPEVGRVVDDLLALWKRLERRAPAAGYLRSEALSSAEVERLRRGAASAVILMADVGEGVRPSVASAIGRPLDFVPMSGPEREGWQRYGGSLVVQSGRTAYRLTVYGVRP